MTSRCGQGSEAGNVAVTATVSARVAIAVRSDQDEQKRRHRWTLKHVTKPSSKMTVVRSVDSSSNL